MWLPFNVSPTTLPCFLTDILTVSVSDSHCTILKMKDLPVPEDTMLDDPSRFLPSITSVLLSFAFPDFSLL